MSQIICLPPTSLGSYPNSPDPTPLRLLAFSVAEAALQPDPNSPSFGFSMNMALNSSRLPSQEDIEAATDRLKALNASRWGAQAEIKSRPTIASRRGKPLWDVVERATERREKDRSSPSSIDSSLPQSPISPTSYNFVLPPNSLLANAVSDTAFASPAYKAKVPGLSITSPSGKPMAFPLFTRSAEPSPTRSVFSALDRSRPPPDFVPRLSAQDFSQKAEEIASAVIKGHGRTKSQSLGGSPTEEPHLEAVSPSQRLRAQSRINMPSRFVSKNKLPSLVELQAKLNQVQQCRDASATSTKSTTTTAAKISHRRGASVDQVKIPLPRSVTPIRNGCQSDFDTPVELIQTPEDEIRRNPYIVLSGVYDNGRPATPPSPSPLGANINTKEPRLAPFLRQRTSGRLIATKNTTSSPEKIAAPLAADFPQQPILRVIPPTLETRRPVQSFAPLPSPSKRDQSISPTSRGFPFPRTPIRSSTLPYSSPTRSTFSHLSTPPSGASSRTTASTTSYTSAQQQSRARVLDSPASPTGSYRSERTSAVASPTLSVPIITCTPAKADGPDSDNESENNDCDVVVFDSEVEEAKERMEREKRGRAMRDLLGSRRRLSE